MDVSRHQDMDTSQLVQQAHVYFTRKNWLSVLFVLMYKIKNHFKWYTFKTYLNKVNYSFLSVHYDTEINFIFIKFLSGQS